MVWFIWTAWQVILSVAALAANEVFVKFSTDDGLSENTVQVIRQDRYGFMWFGTEYGLNRFDGYRFKQYHFDTGDSSGVNDNSVRAVFEDRGGRLWVGTATGGLYCYDRLNDSFRHISHAKNKEGVESVYCLAEDEAGRLWIGSQAGLEQFDPESQTLTLYPHWPHLTASYGQVTVSALVFQGADTLWIGTGNHGLWRLLPSTGECRVFGHHFGPPHDPSHNRISDLVIDRRKRLWMATYGGGLNMFDQQQWYAFHKSEHGLSDDNLFSLFLDDAEKLYIGSEREGLFIADPATFLPAQPQFAQTVQDNSNPKGLGSNNIRAIYRDRAGNLWVGFFKAGLDLSAAQRKRFEHFVAERNNPNSLSNNLVNDIFEDSRGRIWIGTDGGGLNWFDPKTRRFTVFRHDPLRSNSLIHDHVLSILEVDGKLWIGTWGGLAQYDPQTGRFSSFAHAQTKDPSLNNIFRMFIDAHGVIWICTYSGLETFDPHTRQFTTVSIPRASRLTHDWVLTGLQDRRGDIWVGTREGLNRLRRSDWQAGKYEFSFYLHKDYNPKNPRAKIVQTVFETSDGELLAGTLDGLFRYVAERDTFELVRTQDGGLIKGIFRILEDEQHNLWISTMNGLIELDPTGRAVRFDRSDGLQSVEFAFGACKTSSGQLYFGGVNGFNRFYPSEIIRDETPPAVVLTDFRLFNRSTPLSTVAGDPVESERLSITIRPNQSVFSFEFAALDYANPAKCRYAYRMEGLDAEWTFVDATQRLAAYRNLPAGKYTFHVRAANGDGVWNDEGLRVNLRVIPPFWKTNWALLLYVLAAAGILWLLRTVIIAKTHYDAELRLDQMKLNFFTHISHEFRTPLTLILGPVAKILDAGDQLSAGKRRFYRTVIARNAKRLQNLIAQVMDLQKLEKGDLALEPAALEVRRFVENIVESFAFLAESRQIDLRVRCGLAELPAFLDADKVEKIIYNLISNALNYTQSGGRVIVEIDRISRQKDLQKRLSKRLKYGRLNGDWIRIAVADTGAGIAAKHLDHIFERFYRGDHESTFGRSGSGVGLALSKQFAELHGGTLSVESEPGKGSTFTLLLPVGEVAAVADRVVESAVDRALVPPNESVPTGDKPLILIIEDDPDMRLYIAHELSPNYAVTSAANGRQGIACAVETIPDLIICDVIMPEMSGFEVCRSLKCDQRTGHIPIILLTARTEEAAHMQGLQEGADDYIKKPFDAELLHARIVNLLENRRRLQEQFSRKIFLEPTQIEVSSSEAQFLQKAIAAVESHLDDERFSVEQLAREIGLSRAQLYRKVQALIGKTPQELITGLRLQRAAQFLKSSQFTVAEVAYRSGFGDPAHFSKSFKKHFGCSPSHYQG